MTHRSDVSVVVGLDLSLTATGVARVDYFEGNRGSHEVQTVRSKGAKVDSLEARNIRLAHLAGQFETYCGGPRRHVAVESPSHGSTNGHHHDRSGLWWLTVNALLNAGARVYEVAPTQVKKYATGKGNASKAEVMIAAVKRYPEFDIANDNEADAVILAAFLARALGQPIEEIAPPKTHLLALDKFMSQVGTAP